MIRSFVFCLFAFAAPAFATECKDVTYTGNSYTICEVDLPSDDLRLFHSDQNEQVYGHFAELKRAFPDDELVFAMNAGMYHDDRRPVGHYLENGIQKMRVVPNAGPGNFGLLPNGVFCFGPDFAHVIETLRFLDKKPDCPYASQSGPMLVVDGELHPKFLPDGTSKNIRNGVGTTADGTTAIFAISNNSVNFYDFGSLFRDYLNLPQALYFDGRVSRLHALDLNRSDGGVAMGPIVGVLKSDN